MDETPEEVKRLAAKTDLNAAKEEAIRSYVAAAVRNGIPFEEALAAAREYADEVDFLRLTEQRIERFLDNLTPEEMLEVALLIQTNPVLQRYLKALGQIHAEECADIAKAFEEGG